MSSYSRLVVTIAILLVRNWWCNFSHSTKIFQWTNHLGEISPIKNWLITDSPSQQYILWKADFKHLLTVALLPSKKLIVLKQPVIFLLGNLSLLYKWHCSCYFYKKSMELSTILCWKSAHYEFAGSEMGCVHMRWLKHMPRFLVAIAAYSTLWVKKTTLNSCL